MRRTTLRWFAPFVAALAVISSGIVHASAQPEGVYYHDQGGTSLQATLATQAVGMASQRLGFSVKLPATWPKGSLLRTLWVMERQAPRFVVLYYGSQDGYITCQLHESLDGSGIILHWAPSKSVQIGATAAELMQSDIGGANPVSELVWRAHGIRYDLLGSTSTTLPTLMRMAASI